jgi:CheY-like chemotaxis protein
MGSAASRGSAQPAILLRLWGYVVRTVYDGLSVLQAVRDFLPELILLDIELPGMTGYEVAQQLRSQPGLELVVLAAMTGYCQLEDRRRSRAAGFDHHLVKPVTRTGGRPSSDDRLVSDPPMHTPPGRATYSLPIFPSRFRCAIRHCGCIGAAT